MGTTEGLEGIDQYAFAIVMSNDMVPVSAIQEMNYTVADIVTARPGGKSDAPVVLMVLLPKGARPRTTVAPKQLLFTPPIASGGIRTSKSGGKRTISRVVASLQTRVVPRLQARVVASLQARVVARLQRRCSPRALLLRRWSRGKCRQ